MRRHDHLVAMLILAVTAGPAMGAGLSRYKGWGDGPEAYFLTRAERQSWAAVDTDEKAEAFVAAYRASRGGGFAAAIKSRIAFADKAFGLGKKKGSATLQGKTIVILGAPARVEEVRSGTPKDRADPNSGEIAGTTGGEKSRSIGNPYSNVGGSGPDTLRGLQAVARKTTSRWHYDEKTMPVALDLKELTLEFVVTPDEGKEEVREPEKLQKLLDAVIEFHGPKQ